MRKQLPLIALILFTLANSYSQIAFEEGYFIDESNNRIECLIRNMDWRNNPTEFEYKLHSDETVHKATIKHVKEFGINDVSRYIRARTRVDRSTGQLAKMGSDRNPEFSEEVIFLQVLIDGQASLYLYVDGNLSRFFYRVNDSDIEQLIYKKYRIDGKVAENNQFRQQLAILRLQCDEITFSQLERLGYSNRELTRLFVKYNTCVDYSFTNYIKSHQKRDFLNLTLRPGLNYSSMELKYTAYNVRATDFGSKTNVRLGIEAEYIMPFNNNKWGLLIEPTYQRFSAEQSREVHIFDGTLIAMADYESIALPISLRHYFFLNRNSRIFANASYVLDFDLNSEIKIISGSGFTDSSFKNNSVISHFAIGAGYKFRDRYGIEMRLNSNRNIIGSYSTTWTDFKTVSLIFGYSLF